MGEEKRHQMMQNLFGDQSEEEEEMDSEHESNPHPNYVSDEAEGELRNEDEVEGGGQVKGHEDVELESEGEGEAAMREVEPDPGESEGEREPSSQDRKEDSEAKEDTDSDEKEEYGHRVVTSRRHVVVQSGSERSEEQQYHDQEDEEVDQARSASKSPEEKEQAQISQSAVEIRDVFGDTDEEDEGGYAVRDDIEQDTRSPLEEEGSYEKDLHPEDMLVDEDAGYESEENIEAKAKVKPVGPPLEIEMPFRLPPADPTKMNMIKVSNIMGIDSNPFDPKTYVEEKTSSTDEFGAKKRIRLENNIVRWRKVKRPDGTTSVESNARFVRWSDGSLQLLIGNEVLDISIQDAHHDQTHLFLRHNKSLLQSQGRILKKLRCTPSSLSSNSHKMLTAMVDSSHRKCYKVKNCVTDIDPEREKEEKEKAESQNIRASVLLNRKKEKVNKKYTPTGDHRRPQLSSGFLEDALDEDDEEDYYDPRRSRHRLEEDLEVEARAEKRILNAKKGQKDMMRKSSTSSAKQSKRPVDFSDSDREESEYETDGDEDERPSYHKRVEEPEQEYEEDEEEDDRYEEEANGASEEDVQPKQKGKDFGGSHRRGGIESDEDSPPRKMPTHRRMAVVYDTDEE